MRQSGRSRPAGLPWPCAGSGRSSSLALTELDRGVRGRRRRRVTKMKPAHPDGYHEEVVVVPLRSAPWCRNVDMRVFVSQPAKRASGDERGCECDEAAE